MTNVKESTIHSKILDNDRRVWFQPPSEGRPTQATFVLLDGEYYIERMDAPQLIAELQSSPTIPSFSVIYVSHIDGATRWTESFCSERFAQFLDEELLPWADAQFDLDTDGLPAVLGGLSLTGLAAAHAALMCPRRFASVLCQSASFWWSENQIVAISRELKHMPSHFRIVCGDQETKPYVEHSPELIQRTSQLDSNRAMRDLLIEKGCVVSYEEYDGGQRVRVLEVRFARFDRTGACGRLHTGLNLRPFARWPEFVPGGGRRLS